MIYAIHNPLTPHENALLLRLNNFVTFLFKTYAMSKKVINYCKNN